MSRSARAFTAVELLGTTVLVTMLMLGVLSVIGSLGRTHTVLALADTSESRGDRGWSSAMVELIRTDLTHAAAVQMDRRNHTLTLSGFAALHPTTRRQRHEPVEVTYHLQQHEPDNATPSTATEQTSESGNWLVRRQTNANAPANDSSWSDLVCDGVKDMRLLVIQSASSQSSAGGGRSRASDDSERAFTLRSQDRGELPQRVRLIVEWSDPDRPTLDRILQIR